MPFVKKKIHLSSVDLHKKVIKTNFHLTIDSHQKIIMAAEKTANNLIYQAKIKANRLLKKIEQQNQKKILKTKESIQGLIEKTKAQSQEIKDSLVEQTQKEVFLQANDLLSALNQNKQAFFEQNQSFFQNILNDLISELIQNIDLKLRLEMIAQKVIEKAKGLEEGILYFNQADFDHLSNISDIQLPLNWKILVDNDIPAQSCKLRAQGSDWHLNFKQIETIILSFFKS